MTTNNEMSSPDNRVASLEGLLDGRPLITFWHIVCSEKADVAERDAALRSIASFIDDPASESYKIFPDRCSLYGFIHRQRKMPKNDFLHYDERFGDFVHKYDRLPDGAEVRTSEIKSIECIGVISNRDAYLSGGVEKRRVFSAKTWAGAEFCFCSGDPDHAMAAQIAYAHRFDN